MPADGFFTYLAVYRSDYSCLCHIVAYAVQMDFQRELGVVAMVVLVCLDVGV